MDNAEEKLLKEFFQDITLCSDEIEDLKLDTVIHKGIHQASHKKLEFRRNLTVALLAGLAAIVFVIVPWLRDSFELERAQLPLINWGELEVFRPIVEQNITLKSALDAGLVQTIGVTSKEQNDYIFTLDGVVADRKGMYALITVQNNSEDKVLMHGLILKNEKGEDIMYSSNESSWSESDGEPGVTHKYVKILWSDKQEELTQLVAHLMIIPDTPEAMLSSSNEFRTSLTVSFTLDSDFPQPTETMVAIDKRITIAKQNFDVKQAYVGPTGIYVDMAYDKHNTKRIFNLISPKVILGKGSNSTVLNITQTQLNSKTGIHTLVFHNDNLNRNRRMTLEIEGIDALERSEIELIIDTEKQEILKAPDNRVAISDRMAEQKQGVLVLTFFTPKNQLNNPDIGHGFGIDHTFVDGAGSGHWLDYSPENYSTYSEHREDETGRTTTYFFYLGSEKLPQPITFRLTYYPNHFKETASLRIK